MKNRNYIFSEMGAVKKLTEEMFTKKIEQSRNNANCDELWEKVMKEFETATVERGFYVTVDYSKYWFPGVEARLSKNLEGKLRLHILTYLESTNPKKQNEMTICIERVYDAPPEYENPY